MGIADYLVGRRVYNGGTNAPTRGTVDPTGYIERELGMTDSRSGLAAAALRRMGAVTKAPTSGATSNVATSGPVGGVGTSSTGSVGSIPPAILKVNQVGRLQVPDVNQIASQFVAPFDPESEGALTDLQSQRNKFTSDITQAGQGLERDYTTKRRSVEQEEPLNISRLLNDYSGRGLAHSSGYTQDFGDMESQYANMLSQLDQDRSFGQADLLRQQDLFNNDYSTKLTGIQAAAARKAAEALAKKQQAELDAAAANNASVLSGIQTIPGTGLVVPDGYTPQATPAGGPGIVNTADPNQAYGVSPAPAKGSWMNPGPGYSTPSVTPVAPAPVGNPTTAQDPYGAFTAPITNPQTPTTIAPVAPAAPAMNPSTLRWEGPIDAQSRARLAAGQEVVRGNGYVYKMSGPNGTGVPIRIR